MALYLALALLSGVPALVYQVVWTREVGLLVGSQIEGISVVLAAFFGGTDANRLVFSHNVTDALNIVIGSALGPGDHAVSTCLEHNSVLRPLYLKQETDAGRFRKDLYYRVNVVPIHLPPLRERGGDIDLLLAYFMDEARAEGQESPGLSREALSVMKRYRWPGNVRELQSAVRFALVRSRGRIIRPAHLPLELRE